MEMDLQGKWVIISVNGQQGSGLWLELGGEGLAAISSVGTGVFVASPRPQTRAFLGCNRWTPTGWTRRGDQLTLGLEMSHRTERGCDPDRTALDDAAYAILHEAMAIEAAPRDRLRLTNKNGTLVLVRNNGKS